MKSTLAVPYVSGANSISPYASKKSIRSTVSNDHTLNNRGLHSLGVGANAVVIGATGGIGSAFVAKLERLESVSRVFQMSRSPPPNVEPSRWHHIDLEDEPSIAAAATAAGNTVDELHLVIVATGILHDRSGLRPEKSWRSLETQSLEKTFRINAIGPALVAKNFLPKLAKRRKAVFAAMSARVGSIDDNRLGGWHGYRASKAALNMLIKTLAIELAMRNPSALCVGLHPGTVDTGLSKPFQQNVPSESLLSPARSAAALLDVIDNLHPKDSGGVFAWDGTRIPP